MRSRLHWIHSKGQHVSVERGSTYLGETVAKYIVLVVLLYIPAHFFHWENWTAFAAASLYLLWELSRMNDALAELADIWNEQYRAKQEAERDEYLRKRRGERGQSGQS
ncbi:hypothetical protein GCM10014715_74710 [Streptomyces spiralis]|uniref:Uncharacterized protein n=1 Tax=Streptomyces spiralis TaxID=66376 RepID=A0A919AHD9_9ACTN|nr:hypothetical protein [Streptomyces spiralis]GHF07883.1 hypothetical protein GCM10014715_74710 [Streptomyces spiralis]